MIYGSNIFLMGKCLKSLGRRTIFSSRGYQICNVTGKPKSNAMHEILQHRISLTGPITVASYMNEVLNHPVHGYYAKGDILGPNGDFITSPEISQLFGEMIAIWLTSEWRKMGSPKTLQLVELGPGRGTLMSDMLRTLLKLIPALVTSLRGVHLIETSQALQHRQKQTLCHPHHHTSPNSNSIYGPSVTWHSSIDQVPAEYFSFFVANEFFDALPVHKFVRVGNEWREVLIDIDVSSPTLRFVCSREKTPASVALADMWFPPAEYQDMQHLEISPLGGAIVAEMSRRIDRWGGAALVFDYGGESEDTLRAFRGHMQLANVLVEPGTADVTADVNFSYLGQVAKKAGLVTLHGPIEQRHFLERMGILVRKDILKTGINSRLCDDDTKIKMKNSLDSSCQTLLSETEMGKRFKCFSIFPQSMDQIHKRFPPSGFSD